ncbi:hypothetical protein HW132_34635, partial [Brasilonema sp. CT11]|nr:hypothetical protein [Brasilonema sp. CT11]
MPPKKGAKKPPTTVSRANIVVEQPEPIELESLDVDPDETPSPPRTTPPIEVVTPTIAPGTKPKGRVSNTKIVIPEFPVEYM